MKSINDNRNVKENAPDESVAVFARYNYLLEGDAMTKTDEQVSRTLNIGHSINLRASRQIIVFLSVFKAVQDFEL